MVYKKILDYENYFCNECGEIYNFDFNKKIGLSVNKDGYNIVTLNKEGKSKTFSVHRIIAECFIKNPYNKATVNHINGIKTDNRVENLEWMTIQENISHAKSIGLFKNGDNHHLVKIKSIDIFKIKQLFIDGMSQSKISKMYGVSQAYISYLINNKRR